MDGKFTSKDSEKLVELLNFVATKAEFSKLDVKAVLQFTRLLNWAQTDLLPKIEAHKFEVVSLQEPKKKAPKK
jgi:hypothetical protein